MKTDRANIVEGQIPFNLTVANCLDAKYEKSLDLEGEATMKRSIIRVKEKTIARLNPKDEKTIIFKMESEKRLVDTRTQDDWWNALLQMCKSGGMSLTKVQSKSRLREIVELRQCIWFISYHFHKTTLSEIGRFFTKDHATVLHGLRHISTLKSGNRPDMRIVTLMNKLLTDLLKEGMIVSKEYYMKKEYL